jgi:hypothetical protein
MSLATAHHPMLGRNRGAGRTSGQSLIIPREQRIGCRAAWKASDVTTKPRGMGSLDCSPERSPRGS